jgi:ABC-type hemin transport system ATPase subunit
MAGEGLAIEARGLVKVYSQTRALDGIDLTVRRGQVFGFLGPNGAGKTTTIRILATLARPDGGTARVLGLDVASERNAVRARVAVTGQFASLDEGLIGYENLVVFGRLRGLSRSASRQRADELLAVFDLTGSASRPVGGYSGGMAALGLSLSWVWAAVALFVRDPAVVISIANVALMPLSFASNVFVQARTMPGWLQAFVNVNPISHLADAARDLMNNTGGARGPVAWSLIATAAITLVFAPLTLHLYSKHG